MYRSEPMLRGALAVALLAAVAAPAGATTLIRAGLEDLTAVNDTIVVGEVLEAQSYWNAEGTFILTDVKIATDEVLKGAQGSQLTLTLMGGTVGDLTTVIVGGAQLVQGRSYVLFLNREDLPGARGTLTVRDHVQGAFDLVVAKGGDLRAVSQANRHPLLPDFRGNSTPPGGRAGVPFTEMVAAVRALAREQGARREVK